jgi:hypothetical protein
MTAYTGLRSFLLVGAPRLLGAPARATTSSTSDSSWTEAPPAAPFAFADFSWIPGNAGASEKPLTFRAVHRRIPGGCRLPQQLREPEGQHDLRLERGLPPRRVPVTQLGIGGDFSHKNVMGRLMTQFGVYSVTTPRNDARPGRGQWRLDDAVRDENRLTLAMLLKM